jgi:hypothetical protein
MYKTIILVASCLVALPVYAKPILPSHQLQGTHSAGSIGGTCIDNGGTFLNLPNGGYGCAGKAGTVTCNSKGVCTGTCQKCAASKTGGTVEGILKPPTSAGTNAGPASTGSGQKGPIKTGATPPTMGTKGPSPASNSTSHPVVEEHSGGGGRKP